MIVEAVCNQCGVVYMENPDRAHFARYCPTCKQQKEEQESKGCLVLLVLFGTILILWPILKALIDFLKG